MIETGWGECFKMNYLLITSRTFRFEAVPSSLYGSAGLEILIARDNKITAIDAAGLASIPRLATLDLANNNIESVPPQLGLLRLL